MIKIIKKTCLINISREYRWNLELKISHRKKEVIFVGLNPSLTDETFLDNTTKKIIKISNKNKYGIIKIINLFGLRSSSPKLLLDHPDPIGYCNNLITSLTLKYWSEQKNCDIWLGWGNQGDLYDRDLYFYKLFKKYLYIKRQNFLKTKNPFIIKKTMKGFPIHPLYCQDSSFLKEFNNIRMLLN